MMRAGSVLAIAMMMLGSAAPTSAASNDEAWAHCLATEMPESLQKWLSLPKAGHRAYVDFVLFDSNFSKGVDAKLSTNDEFRSEFAALRLESACDGKVVDAKSKPIAFNAGRVRKFLEKGSFTFSGVDRLDPEHHVCVAYRDNLIHGLAMGVGPSSKVKLVDTSATLRCFRATSGGDLIEDSDGQQTGLGE